MCPVALVGALLIVLSSLLLGCGHSYLSYLFVHTFLCRETLVGVTTTQLLSPLPALFYTRMRRKSFLAAAGTVCNNPIFAKRQRPDGLEPLASKYDKALVPAWLPLITWYKNNHIENNRKQLENCVSITGSLPSVKIK